MTVINTNTAATLTANALTKNERAMSQTMERLSTGSRINSASDDAAGLAISSKMTSQINGLNMAVRNANDGISMVQTADGALIEITDMLQRMRELSIQAANGTNSASDRTYLQDEVNLLIQEVTRISANTRYNGSLILDGTFINKQLQVYRGRRTHYFLGRFNCSQANWRTYPHRRWCKPRNTRSNCAN